MTGSSKGISLQPIITIEVLATTMLLIGVINATVIDSSDFIKSETASIQATRISNAALALNTLDAGNMELDLSGYELKYDPDQEKIQVKYAKTVENASLSEANDQYFDISANDFLSYQKVDGKICLDKEYFPATGSAELDIMAGECPSSSSSDFGETLLGLGD